jgi:uncharacterized protein (TIGR00725 family)
MAQPQPLNGGDRATPSAELQQGDVFPACEPDPEVRQIGLMGSSGGVLDPDVCRRSFELGAAIARAHCVLVTGACPGYPHDAARGAQAAGGLSVGVSPALCRSEHIARYDSPVDAYDVIIYTGSGLMGREVHNIHSSDLVIFVGGRSGTLGEFCIAYDEGKLIGVLAGSGGVSDALSTIVPTLGKKTGAVLVYEADPERLVRRCIEIYHREHYRRPSSLAVPVEQQEATWVGSRSSAPRVS